MVANNEHPYRVVFVSVRLVTEQISPMFVFVENVRFAGAAPAMAWLRELSPPGGRPPAAHAREYTPEYLQELRRL
jgi:hypothetical protein